MEIDDVAIRRNDIKIPTSDQLILRGHTSEVFDCSWNPINNFLASGSGDSTARIWNIPNKLTMTRSIKPTILHHPQVEVNPYLQSQQMNTNHITTVSWNPNGRVLGTGCADGCTRLWQSNGELKHTFKLHNGPIFSLKWNKSGSRILSCSIDASIAVWNGYTGILLRHFKLHTKATLDADWRDDSTFASCSADKTIYLCDVNTPEPIQTYTGHTGEINCVKFDPSETLLASCSDDFTAKIWTQTSSQPVHNLDEHYGEVFSLQWAPKRNYKFILATASFDNSVKFWDANYGKCIRTLSDHTGAVYSLDFSPNSEFLVTGSVDKSINIWSVKDGTLLKKCSGVGVPFEVNWNSAGDMVAACCNNNTVTILDMRKMVTASNLLSL